MIESLLRFSIKRRVLILFAVLGLVILGGLSYHRLPIDAVPDITNVQVQINTEALGYSPLEAEQRITWPVETALSGLPNLAYTRSLSRYGLSQVTVAFEMAPTFTSRAILSTSALAKSKANYQQDWNPLWGHNRHRLGRDFHVRGRGQTRRQTGGWSPF